MSSNLRHAADTLAQHKVELERLRCLLDDVFTNGSYSKEYPEDIVVFSMLVSCSDICREILFLVAGGHGRAAFRAVRTMYECLVTAHYFKRHPESVDDFMQRLHVHWAKIRRGVPDEFRNSEMDKQLAELVPKYREGGKIGLQDLKWSSDKIYDMAKAAGAIFALHPTAFVHTSAYIHPSALSTIRMVSHSATGLEIGKRPQSHEAIWALRTGHDLILNGVALRFQYKGTDSQRVLFDNCAADFANLWGYPPHV
jgi:hypothetical protein